MVGSIIARQSELAALDDFLASSDQWPRALFFEGAAGIGKTRLWREGLERAQSHGVRVLVTRPGSAEVRLAFAGLADLLRDDLDEVLVRLPAPQRRAPLLRPGGAVRVGRPATEEEPRCRRTSCCRA